MAAPSVVQASNGLALASGDGVVSLPGTTLGNLIVLHVLSKAASGDYGADTFTQLENLSAVGGTMELSGINAPVGSGPAASHDHWLGRSLGGDVSAHLTVGGSGADIYARLYEIADVVGGTTPQEGGNEVGDTSSTIADSAVTTSGGDRLAFQLIAVAADLALDPFSGESGGDWTEAVAEYRSALGTGAALGLQVAALAAPTTINGGTDALGASADWGILSGAFIPSAVTASPAQVRPVSSGWRW